MLSAQTPGTNVNFPLLTISNDSSSMNIGQPAPLDTFLRMTYAIAKLNSFTTNITLHKKSPLFLYYKSYFGYYTSEHHIRQKRKNAN